MSQDSVHEIPNKLQRANKVVEEDVEVEQEDDPKMIYGQTSSPYKDDPIGNNPLI